MVSVMHGHNLRILTAEHGSWQNGRMAGMATYVLFMVHADTNTDDDRRITHELYGGGLETRIAQEIVLGMGGVRALRALGFAPTVWHVNEGHAAFMMLERPAPSGSDILQSNGLWLMKRCRKPTRRSSRCCRSDVISMLILGIMWTAK